METLDPRERLTIVIDQALADPAGPGGAEAFWNFVQVAWAHVPGDPNANRFVETRYMYALCTHVFQPCWSQRKWSVEQWPKQTLINIPPSHAKSMLANVLWPAWVWGPAGDPTHAFAHLSYDQTGVSRDSRKCRGLLESEWYRERWGGRASLVKGDNNVELYTNHAGGFRYCNTIRGGITGKHFNTILLDDPQNPSKLRISDAGDAAAEAQKAREVIDDVLPSRVLDEHTRFVTIMQRLGETDASQHLVDKYQGRPDALAHIVLPLEFDPDRKHPIDWRVEPGELLSPERFSREYWDEQFLYMPHEVVSAQYQQVAAAAGLGLFKPADFRRWRQEDLPLSGIWGVSLDAAQEGRATTTQQKLAAERSHWVAQVWVKSGRERFLYRQVRLQDDFTKALEAVVALCESVAEEQAANRRANRGCRWSPGELLVEAQAAGPQFLDVLKSVSPTPGGLRPERWNTGTRSKLERAESCLPTVRAGCVWLPADEASTGTQGLLDRLCKFPRGKHDDEVDALSQYVLRNLAEEMDYGQMLKNLRKLAQRS